MTTAQDVIAEARTWVGTPFRHQARVKGLGADCVGMIVAVGMKYGFIQADYTNYGREPHKAILERELGARMDWLGDVEPRPADVLLLKFLGEPQHVALFTGTSMIHAYSSIGKCIEHGVDDKWRNRIVGVFRYRGLDHRGLDDRSPL